MSKRLKMCKVSKIKTFDELFDEFIKNCKARNLTDATIKYYHTCFHILKKFRQEIYLEDINEDFIRDYILFLKETMKPVSINTQILGIRVIVKYGARIGAMEEVEIKKLKYDKEIKETYTQEQIGLLLVKPNMKKCSFAEYRNWMMINWFTATGNRIGTVREIKIEDLDLANQLVTLRHTKNRSQNIIPIPTSLCTLLREYLQYRNGNPEDYLFPTIDNGQLSAQGIKTAIKKYNRKRGVNVTSCHAFRRYFAKQCVLNGIDTFTLQRLGGWKDLDVVRNYVHLYATDIKNYDEVNPLEQIYSSMGKKVTMKKKGERSNG